MPRKILYLVSEDWYFISHRLPMARAARDAGFEVHVATRIGDHEAAIRREGFVLHPVHWQRGSLNPLRMLVAVLETRRVYRQVKPDLLHHVALVPSVIGSLAAMGQPGVCLNALAGLGYVFTSNAPKARAVRPLASRLLRWLLNRRNSFVLVQNRDDHAVVAGLGVAPEAIAIIPGSGVDIDRLKPMPEPSGPFTVGFVGRLLDDKGVRTLVAAHELLAQRGVTVRTMLAGEPDPSNPASIPEQTLSRWRRLPNLELPGHVADIRDVWDKAHVAVLPSRREGLPMSLLEAAACGRPLIATDVPGCREIARHGINALLVPADDAEALAGAIEALWRDGDSRIRFGNASRQIAVEEYSSARIGREITTLYERLLSPSDRDRQGRAVI